jgi:hypothetical protein
MLFFSPQWRERGGEDGERDAQARSLPDPVGVVVCHIMRRLRSSLRRRVICRLCRVILLLFLSLGWCTGANSSVGTEVGV